MLRLLSLWLMSLAILPAFAIHASEAGVVDWYKPLIGDALTGNPNLSPVFHRITEDNGKTRSLVLTATSSNVLSGLHPENGSIAWRYLFEDGNRVLAFKKHKNWVAAVSGVGGATVRVLDVSTGHLLHERHLHKPEAGRLLEPDSTGVALAFDSGSHVYALTNGHTVRKIEVSTGKIIWGWTAPDQTSLNVYSTVLPTSSAIYLIGLAKSFASYTLHITSLSPVDGSLLSSVDVPSSIEHGPASLFVLSKPVGESEHARILWLESNQIRSVKLMSGLNETPTAIKAATYRELVDLGLGDHGLLVAVKDDGSGQVIKLNDEGTGLKIIWEFADSADSTQHTASMYTGGLDKAGHPYIGRVFWSRYYKKASAHILAPHLAEGKGLVTGYTLPFETAVHGIIGNVAIDAVNLEEFRVLARVVITTTTGAIQLWQQDQLQWTREEGLADIRVAEFVELPERKLAETGLGEGHETFTGRVRRQISEARDFPHYALHFAKRFVTGSYDSVSSSAMPTTSDVASLSRDTFGFRKILVAATARGKVYGIDSANGEILWSRVFGLGWAAEVGGHVLPLKIYTTRTVMDEETPQVVIVTQRKANNGLLDTVLFHIDALTGEDSTGKSRSSDVLQGIDIIAGALVEAYLVRDEATKFVLLFDEFLQAHVYPDTAENTASFAKLIPSLHFALRTGQVGSLRLTGHRFGLQKEFTGKYIAHPTWTASLAEGEDIQAIIARPHEPVASLGKVLGNRTTMYKYLNPNVVAVVTSSLKAPTPSCAIYLMDVVKGSIIYHSVLPAVSGACDVKAAFTDNWLVYHYYDEDFGVDQAKSYRVVSVEFYEGTGIDDKISSSDLSSHSNASTSVHVLEQTYVFPRGISTMATTMTKFGITSKDLIVAGENGIIQSFPRRFFDPRRPKRKPTNEELEEWLIQYDPVIPDDPKRVLSHTYQVANVRAIITSPALLESTSLVFAHGLDLFSTRVTPSNTFDVLSENFNKAQLVLTISGLALAILITKPMVRNKRLRERWYN
ncbi:uncharacterized protein PHACADRAFT_116839 [Phanerochaete carnosa HHB-10118-sp]|uniref:ER membrane protein complex subunit 1 n=1 Tax=Phanerochaete carnosa (strain HHB-10118-sp) TaxID=650164 RepID=K5X5M1_PHACS|nr:uncharacterized protein PHACADRAFT_116839 [Phanerochaete carnosa HHB-10118-sp]EKM58157.1 hypothetical protein PHACADRAFT_116839 [Phanerochaete carnosa HHB-10118-sp]